MGPSVLLIHGFGGNADHWRKNTAELAKSEQRARFLSVLPLHWKRFIFGTVLAAEWRSEVGFTKIVCALRFFGENAVERARGRVLACLRCLCQAWRTARSWGGQGEEDR